MESYPAVTTTCSIVRAPECRGTCTCTCNSNIMTRTDEDDGLQLSPGAGEASTATVPSEKVAPSDLDHLESSFREILTASFSKSQATTSEEEQEKLRQSYQIVDIMSSLRDGFIEGGNKSLLDFFSEDGRSTSDWEEGVAVIESILLPQSNARKALSDSQIQGLRKVQQLLWTGPQSTESHIPKALLDAVPEPGSTSDYILAQFAGIKRVRAKQKFFNVVNANRFLYRLKLQTSSSRRLKTNNKEVFVPMEWSRLELDEQVQLANLLSWENLQKWDFDVFEVDRLTHGQPLTFIGWAIMASPYSQFVMAQSVHILQQEQAATEGEDSHKPPRPPALEDMQGYGYTDEFKIPQDCLVKFLRTVEKEYVADNPYHNNIHAADVVQSLHSMLQGMGAKTLAVAEIELFSLLLAAVVHDMGHPGKNNSFQVNSHSDLAIQYNDQSVLENMHASLAFRLLLGAHRDATMNIFAGMSNEQVMACRKMIIEAVLSTDMTHHFSSVNKIKGIRLAHQDSAKDSNVGAKKYADGDAWQILHFALHLSDISNPAKPLPLAIQWTDRCLDEFFQQGDEEKRLGLPVSPLCDRMTTQRADSQIGFIKFVVLPAYEILGKIVPEVRQQILPTLESNLKYWVEQKGQDEKGDGLIMEASERSEVSGSEEKETSRS